MTTTKSKRTTPASVHGASHPPLFYRLHELLETVRSIAEHEDELCTLVNEVKTARALDTGAARELRELLAAMFASDYARDLHGVLRALPKVGVPARQAKVVKGAAVKKGSARRPARNPASSTQPNARRAVAKSAPKKTRKESRRRS